MLLGLVGLTGRLILRPPYGKGRATRNSLVFVVRTETYPFGATRCRRPRCGHIRRPYPPRRWGGQMIWMRGSCSTEPIGVVTRPILRDAYAHRARERKRVCARHPERLALHRLPARRHERGNIGPKLAYPRPPPPRFRTTRLPHSAQAAALPSSVSGSRSTGRTPRKAPKI